MPRNYAELSEESCIRRYTQPEPWEKMLEDVTVTLDYHEQPFDPAVLRELCHGLESLNLFEGPVDVYRNEECARQIARIRAIAMRKLRGIPRKCVLLLLATNARYKQIAEWLHVSEDTVSRALQTAVNQIREFLKSSDSGAFPCGRGKHPVLRVSVFPLDTEAEKQQFQLFMNRQSIEHVSYQSDGLFREALVVYKASNRRGRKTTAANGISNDVA